MAHPAGMLFRFLTVYDQNPEGTQYRRILPLTTVGVAVDAQRCVEPGGLQIYGDVLAVAAL